MQSNSKNKPYFILLCFTLGCFYHLHAQIQSKGTTYALIVGISDYKDDQITDLNYAHRDAEAFANFLTSKPGRWFAYYQLAMETSRKDPNKAMELYQKAATFQDRSFNRMAKPGFV